MPISDHDLVQLTRRVLRASPFAGEGYRKLRAERALGHGRDHGLDPG